MKAIQEFISLLQKWGVTSAEGLKIPFKNESQTKQLFHFLQDQESPVDLSSINIHPRIIRSLEAQLLRSLFLVDTKKMGKTPRQQAYYYCWKNLCAVKVLLGQSAHQAAIHLTNKVLYRAKKYDLPDLCLECYKILRWYYGCIDVSSSRYQTYDQLLKKQQDACAAEQVAEDYYIFLSNVYQTDKGQRLFLADQALKYWEEVSSLMAEYRSRRLHFLGHLIHVFHYSCAGEFQGAICANEQAVSYFEQTEGARSTYLSPFLNHQLACCVKLKKLEMGESLISKIEKQVKTGSFDWFITRQQYFLLAMHSRHYERARNILKQAVSQRRFKYLSRTQFERWRINQAYLYYLECVKRLSTPPKSRRGFHAKKFLNSVPLYAKDKRGMNVPILVIAILILLAENRYSEVIDRTEALDKYRRRYLKTEDAYRSNCFIQMLTTLPKANFHPKAVERKTEIHRKNLAQVPLQVSPQAFELEIIPYEDLWIMVLESL